MLSVNVNNIIVITTDQPRHALEVTRQAVDDIGTRSISPWPMPRPSRLCCDDVRWARSGHPGGLESSPLPLLTGLPWPVKPRLVSTLLSTGPETGLANTSPFFLLLLNPSRSVPGAVSVP